MTQNEPMRLNKYLSDSGFCSRREADRLVEQGKVVIDGEVAQLGQKVKPGQNIVINGKPLKREEERILIAFNKPRGIVCTTSKKDKDNIVDYLNYGKRIYPIGRLDKDSEGLILLTNKGDIVDKILRGSNYHEKEYVVTVNKKMTKEFVEGMEAGVPILDTVTRPCKLHVVNDRTFRIIISQGLNRQIRRMCEYFGYRVQKLKRVRIMNIQLNHLKVGTYRNISNEEWTKLNALLNKDRKGC
ncbi:MAG TPA: 23S rRNA pseudouridine(2604) synthase RluF [Lachnospiraceae bacterium]|nr:23S rRNA pseudouridine(2604) synthase RluF [uncultured Lachnoclostridium sp.]HAU86087.1 23S rRNA pseudouridine(2604) synthase RluF [Lachnospiraceae bacterium]